MDNIKLTRKGICIDFKYLHNKIGMKKIRSISNKFTIRTRSHNNIYKTIKCFKKKKGIIYIPRCSGIKLSPLIGDIKNELHNGDDVDYKDSTMILTPNQDIVCNHLMKNIYNDDNKSSGMSSCILQMDPGYGKTYLSLGIIENIRKKTMIIVPNTYLLNQWYEILTNAFPNNMIGLYYGKKKIDGDIIISIINSALKYTDYDDIGLIIYDEVHMYCSKKYSQIFTTAQSINCLGLTATPHERIDKFDNVYVWHLGDIIYASKIDGWDANHIEFKTNVTRVIYNGPESHTKLLESNMGVVSVPLMINQLQEDPYRNNMIVKYAIDMYNKGLCVFVFSDRREHLHNIATKLINLNIDIKAPELEGIKELMGGSNDVDIKEAKDNGRVILTTYQYSGTGISINKMNSLILSTPRRSNMKQILGRIYRLNSDYDITREIIDIMDNRICLKNQYYTRKKTYINGLNANIVDIKHNWDDFI